MQNQYLTKKRIWAAEVPRTLDSKNLKSRIMSLAVPLPENLGLAKALLAERKVFDVAAAHQQMAAFPDNAGTLRGYIDAHDWLS